MTDQQARTEAERCLYCFDAPCVEACPTHIDIPKFIAMMRMNNLRGAAEVVRTRNALANVCGKVCPEEVFCQSVCNRAKIDEPVQIRELHFHATEFEYHAGYSKLVSFPSRMQKIAVVGGGPAGLGCAFELVKFGYQTTVFDAHGLGGVPQRSIPDFRLNDDVLQSDIGLLSCYFEFKRLHVDDPTLDALRKDFAAVFVSVGLGKDRNVGIKGETLPGVVPVLKFLEEARAGKFVKPPAEKVIIIGGGNVSLDAAATAKRLGAKEVVLLYRRSENEMKIWKSELNEARKQGVEFRFLAIPVEIVGPASVTGVRCRNTRLSSQRDASGRPIPVEVEGSEHLLPCEMVIVAIGQEIPSAYFKHLKRNARGFIEVDDRFRTSVSGIFAGGDAIHGEGTIVQSVAHGKQAAWAMHEYLEAAEMRRRL